MYRSGQHPDMNLLDVTEGIVFLGTPFRGSKAELLARVRELIARVMGASSSSALLEVLRNADGFLTRVRHQFAGLAHQRWRHPCRLTCFYETEPTEFRKAVLPKGVSWLMPMVVSAKGISSRLSITDSGMKLVDIESASLDGNRLVCQSIIQCSTSSGVPKIRITRK